MTTLVAKNGIDTLILNNTKAFKLSNSNRLLVSDEKELGLIEKWLFVYEISSIYFNSEDDSEFFTDYELVSLYDSDVTNAIELFN